LIQEIEVVGGAIPLTRTEPVQQWTEEWSTQLYVKAVASGLVGWGQVLPSGGNSTQPFRAILERLRADVLGRDESDVRGLWNAMRRTTFTGGYGMTTGAISGIDIALWDLAARKAGLPLAGLLGGTGRRVRRYASLARYRTVDQVVEVVGRLRDAGYRSVKLHQPRETMLDAIRAVRDRYGSEPILSADLNCAFGLEAAVDFMNRVQRFELEWIEEPVWPPDDFDALKRLNRLGPIAAGENAFSLLEFKRLVEMEALTYLQPDIAKVGGVTPALEILSVAKSHGVSVAFHNRPDNGWVSTMASAHLASAVAPEALIETPPNEIPGGVFAFQGVVEKNEIQVGGPGLGIAPLDTAPRSGEARALRFHDP